MEPVKLIAVNYFYDTPSFSQAEIHAYKGLAQSQLEQLRLGMEFGGLKQGYRRWVINLNSNKSIVFHCLIQYGIGTVKINLVDTQKAEEKIREVTNLVIMLMVFNPDTGETYYLVTPLSPRGFSTNSSYNIWNLSSGVQHSRVGGTGTNQYFSIYKDADYEMISTKTSIKNKPSYKLLTPEVELGTIPVLIPVVTWTEWSGPNSEISHQSPEIPAFLPPWGGGEPIWGAVITFTQDVSIGQTKSQTLTYNGKVIKTVTSSRTAYGHGEYSLFIAGVFNSYQFNTSFNYSIHTSYNEIEIQRNPLNSSVWQYRIRTAQESYTITDRLFPGFNMIINYSDGPWIDITPPLPTLTMLNRNTYKLGNNNTIVLEVATLMSDFYFTVYKNSDVYSQSIFSHDKVIILSDKSNLKFVLGAGSGFANGFVLGNCRITEEVK